MIHIKILQWRTFILTCHKYEWRVFYISMSHVPYMNKLWKLGERVEIVHKMRVISKEIIDAEEWNKCALFNIFKIGTNMCMISSWFPHDFFMIFHEKSCTYFYIFPRYKYVKMCAWFVMCMIPPWFPTEICRNVCMISLWISTHLGMSHVTHESSCHNNE